MTKTAPIQLVALLLTGLVCAGVYADPDVNDDGVVNFLDLQAFQECFLVDYSVDFQPSCASVDQNGDNIVNFLDTASFIEFFGRHYPAPDASAKFYPNLIVPVPSGINVSTTDITGDDALDLIGVSFPNTISIAEGNNDGTFSASVRQFIQCEEPGYELSVAEFLDVNSDGFPDIIAVCSVPFEDQFLTVYLSDENAQYQRTNSWPLTGFDHRIYLTDIDGDGVTDVAAARRGFFDEIGSVQFFKNNEDGTLSPYASLPVPEDTRLLQFADADGDGFSDVLMVARDFPQNFNGPLSLYKGDGLGNFAAAEILDPEVGSSWLLVFDANEDTYPDIIGCCRLSNTSYIFLGGPDGQFQARSDIGSLLGSIDLQAVDLDNDTHIDIATIGSNGRLQSVLLTPGETLPNISGFAPFTSLSLDVNFGDIVKPFFVDLVPNSLPDMILPDSLGTGIKPLNLGFELAPNLPMVEEPQVVSTGSEFESFVSGDFTSDGRLDFVGIETNISTQTVIRTLRGTASGSFASQSVLLDSGLASALESGDFNGDGHLDIAVARGVVRETRLYFGDGNGNFEVGTTFDRGGQSVAATDVNDDGHIDLLLGSSTNLSIDVMLGDGTGAYSLGQTIDVNDLPLSISIADIDANGSVDLVSRSNYALTVLLSADNGEFSVADTIVVGQPTDVFSAARDLDIGHLDDDGLLDIVVGLSGTTVGPANILLLQGNGDGSFTERTNYVMPPPLNVRVPGAVRIVDVNDDDVPDLVVQEKFEAMTYIYLGADFFEFDKYQRYGPIHGDQQTTSGDMMIVDLDGDGQSDIVHAVTGSNPVLSIFKQQ